MKADESVEGGTARRARRIAWPRDVSFGIIVGVVAAGLIWLVLALLVHYL